MADKKSLSDLAELTQEPAEAPAAEADAGTEHPHAGTQPKPLDVASMNRKNKVAK